MRAAILFLIGLSLLFYMVWRVFFAPKSENDPVSFLTMIKGDIIKVSRVVGQFAPHALVGLVVGVILVLVFSINYS